MTRQPVEDQLLLQVDPEHKAHLPKHNNEAGLRPLGRYTALGNEPREQRAAAVRRLARLRLATGQAKELARRTRPLARSDFEPLTVVRCENAALHLR